MALVKAGSTCATEAEIEILLIHRKIAIIASRPLKSK